jgi:hypothetical protein
MFHVKHRPVLGPIESRGTVQASREAPTAGATHQGTTGSWRRSSGRTGCGAECVPMRGEAGWQAEVIAPERADPDPMRERVKGMVFAAAVIALGSPCRPGQTAFGPTGGEQG